MEATIGILLAVIGILVTVLLSTKGGQDFLDRIFRRARARTPARRYSEVVPYRVPLHIRAGNHFGKTAFNPSRPESLLLQLLQNRQQKILVIGQPGCGKSQLAQYLHDRIAADHPHAYLALVKKEQRDQGPLDQQIALQFEVERLPSPTLLGQKDHAVIILDGIDEVEVGERKALLETIDRWVSVGVSSLITARSDFALPEPYRDLYTPQAYTIQTLNRDQILEIVSKWIPQDGRPRPASLYRAVEGSLADRSLWSPSVIDQALSNPFYLAHACQFYVDRGSFPRARHEVLEKIVDDKLASIAEDLREGASLLLIKIAVAAHEEARGASVVALPEVYVRERLLAQDESHRIAGRVTVDHLSALLGTKLINQVGSTLHFGVHGLIYHYVLARHLVQKGLSGFEEIRDLGRPVVELVGSLLPQPAAIRLARNWLQASIEEFPLSAKILVQNENKDPRLPFFFIASVRDLPISLIDEFIAAALERCKLPDGPTRWTAIDMIANLGQHVRASAKLVEAMKSNGPDVVADIAEVVCWVGQRRYAWSDWALCEFERIARYMTDNFHSKESFHPLLHVVEGIARLNLHLREDSQQLLRALADSSDPVVRFSAVSLLGSSDRLWTSLGQDVLDWVTSKEQAREKDYIICHGYYPLRWFSHHRFGTHPAIQEAARLIKYRTDELCRQAGAEPKGGDPSLAVFNEGTQGFSI